MLFKLLDKHTFAVIYIFLVHVENKLGLMNLLTFFYSEFDRIDLCIE